MVRAAHALLRNVACCGAKPFEKRLVMRAVRDHDRTGCAALREEKFFAGFFQRPANWRNEYHG